MKKINLYIIKQILIGFLIVSFSLMAILWLTQSLRFVDFITNKGISLTTFAELTSLLMPRIFTILSPLALFASVLFVYNRMLTDRELVVIKAAGFSPWQMCRPAFGVGVLIALLNVYVYNVGIPWSERAFNELEWKIKNNVSHLMFRDGEFIQLQPNLTVFIAAHERDDTISGILVNDERNPDSKVTLSAEKGRIVYTDKGPKAILVKGVRQEVNSKNKSFSSLSFDRYSIDFGTPESKRKKERSVREYGLVELLEARNNQNLNEVNQKRFFVEGNKRIVDPFFLVLMAMLGCVGLIIGNFNRRGQIKIISVSILAMVVVQALSLILTNLAKKNLWFIFGIYLNALIPLVVCFYLLFLYNPLFFKKMLRAKHA